MGHARRQFVSRKVSRQYGRRVQSTVRKVGASLSRSGHPPRQTALRVLRLRRSLGRLSKRKALEVKVTTPDRKCTARPRRKRGKRGSGGVSVELGTPSKACTDAPVVRKDRRVQPKRQSAAPPLERKVSKAASVKDRSRVCKFLYYAARAIACLAVEPEGNRISWIIDSGANVVVVPTNSSNILRWLPEGGVPVKTAGGIVIGRRVVAHTPLGDQIGIALPDAPHLLPMWLIADKGLGSFRWVDRTPVVKHKGKRLRVWLSGGNPMVSCRRRKGQLADSKGDAGVGTSVASSSDVESERLGEFPESVSQSVKEAEERSLLGPSGALVVKAATFGHDNNRTSTETACQTTDDGRQSSFPAHQSCYDVCSESMPVGYCEAMERLHKPVGLLVDEALDAFDAYWAETGQCLWEWNQTLQGVGVHKDDEKTRTGVLVACSAVVTDVSLDDGVTEDECNYLEEVTQLELEITANSEEVRQWYAEGERRECSGTLFFAPKTVCLAPGESQTVEFSVSARATCNGRPAAWFLVDPSLEGDEAVVVVEPEQVYAGQSPLAVSCVLKNVSSTAQTVLQGACVARAVGALTSEDTCCVATVLETVLAQGTPSGSPTVAPTVPIDHDIDGGGTVAGQSEVRQSPVVGPEDLSQLQGQDGLTAGACEAAAAFPAQRLFEKEVARILRDGPGRGKPVEPDQPVVKRELFPQDNKHVSNTRTGPNRQMRPDKVMPERRLQVAVDPNSPPPPEHFFTHFPAHPNCPACMRGKLTTAVRHRSDQKLKLEERAHVPGERLLADLCGPWPRAVHNEDTLLVILEECTGLIFLFALKGKFASGVKFAITEVRKQLNELRQFMKIKDPVTWSLKVDLGGEFNIQNFTEYLGEAHGTIETVPQGRHVAVVERCLREVTEGIRTLLTAAGLPATFWPYAATAWEHNYNMDCEVWRECQSHHKRVCHKQVFGLLAFTKLSIDSQRLPKGCEVGSPVAYLGPQPHSRKGSCILYLRQSDKKYKTTTVDDTGLRFTTTGEYAFKRAYLDLNTISLPGTTMTAAGKTTIVQSNPGAVVGTGIMQMASPPNTKKSKRWVRPDSNCSNCRNANHHGHSFEGRGPTMCRFSQLNNEKLNTLMNLGAEGSPMYELIDEVVEKLLRKVSWGVALRDMQKTVEKILLAKAQRALDVSKDVGDVDIPAVRTHFVNHGSFGKTDSMGVDETKPTVFYTKVGEEIKPTAHWRDTVVEMNQQLLTEQDRCKMIGDSHLTQAWETLEAYTRTAAAFVTRNMNRVERSSDLAKKALSDEMAKVESKLTFGEPLTFTQAKAKFPEGTVSGLCMLGSVKHAEKALAFQKYKGRLVVLGNAISRLKDLVMVFPKGADFGMQGQVASLAAFRAVAWHSTRPGYVLEAADVSNAYLNASWPAEHQPHFLRIDQTVFGALSQGMQDKVTKLGGWQHALLPMDKCLYGHPISGFMWIEMLRKWLMSPEQGFVEVDGVPSLFKKDEMLICVYVDDVAAAGPKAAVQKLWADMKLQWDLRESEECTEFLGIQVSRQLADGDRRGFGYEVQLSMADYVNGIVKTLKEEFPTVLLYPRYVPMTDSQDDALAHQHTKPAVAPQHRCMKIIGQLIWLARCVRPDVSYSVSKLASGISRWGPEHDEVLGQVVGYLLQSQTFSLKFSPPNPDRELVIQLCPDASWSAPRSQSGACCVIGHVEPGREVDGQYQLFTPEEILDGQQGLEVLGMFEGASTRQSLSADSSACSELISAHTCVRNMLPLALGLRETWEIASPVNLREDNKALCEIARSGNTKGLAYLASKPMCIRASCLHDLTELRAIIVTYVRTHKQLGDCFTKALNRVKLEISRLMLGLGPPLPVDSTKTVVAEK